jgi:hypothetical protein
MNLPKKETLDEWAKAQGEKSMRLLQKKQPALNEKAKKHWLAIMLTAVGVAATSFLFINSYNPSMGLLWNIMNGEITARRMG